MWTTDVQAGTTYRWQRDACAYDSEDDNMAAGELVEEIVKDKGEEDDDDDDEEDDDEDDWDDGSPMYRHRFFDLYDNKLKVLPGYHRGPLVVEILEYFLELPPCKSANIYPLTGLALRRDDLPHHNYYKQIFDDVYMRDMCTSLEIWLRRHRDGMSAYGLYDRPRFGECRLEYLAYRPFYGCLYFESGPEEWKESEEWVDPLQLSRKY